MNLTTRIGLVAAIVAGLGSALAWLAGGSGPAAAAPSSVRWESSAQCKDCHQDVYAEWFGSHHQIAFTNPEVRETSDDFRKEECMDCHLPRPLAVTGFGKRTLPRRTHFDEGVSCISCHLGADGAILARRDRPEVPCRPRADTEFSSVLACKSCHNQHDTTNQWEASHYAQQGQDCNHCHMPHVERKRADGSIRMGRQHVYPGAHDKAMLQSAGRFSAEKRGNDIVLRLENTGAGHNFPTEERHRAVDLMVRFVDAGGAAGDWIRAYRFRQPYRDEPGENTQLPAGQHKEVTVPIPAGAVRAETRMWYRLTPFVGDDDVKSTLLDERTVLLP